MDSIEYIDMYIFVMLIKYVYVLFYVSVLCTTIMHSVLISIVFRSCIL